MRNLLTSFSRPDHVFDRPLFESLSPFIQRRNSSPSISLAVLAFFVSCLLGSTNLQAAIINVPGDQPTISAAVAAAVAGDEIVVAPGIYNENVVVNKSLIIRSSGGRAVTTVNGSPGTLGTFLIQASNVTIGGPGQGFTINGYDNSDPGLEYAAIYIQGARNNITIRGNDIVANGEAGLLTEFGNAVNSLTINANIFSGKTFTGSEAGDCGFADQFTAPNVPRQLANIPTGTGITFTSNQITGIAGSSSTVGACVSTGQGNTLVTIDANNATIIGNTFAGTTTRFGHSLRVRGTGANISCNTFDNTGLGLGCVHIFFNATSIGALGTPNTLAGVAGDNVFIDEGAYFTGATQIYRSSAQVAAIPQTPIAANSAAVAFVTNTNTGLSYCSIQAAIDDVNTLNGHTITVGAGTYSENVTINKSLELRGANFGISGCGTRVAESVIQGVFTLGTNGITIDGFEFTGAGAQIRSSGSLSTESNITIRNNYIHATTAGQPVLHGFGFGGGIGSMNWTVSNNKIEDIQAANATAIALFNITNATVNNNCITHTNALFNGRRGINADGLQTAMITGNTIALGGNPSTNVEGAWVIQVSMSDRGVSNITISDNTLSGAYTGITTLSQSNVTGLSITGNVIGPVSLGISLNTGGVVPQIAQPVQSNINITNNAITTVTPTITGGIGASVRLRNLHAMHANGPVSFSNVSINDNSFSVPTGDASIIYESGLNITNENATCNWYGTTNAATIASLISGSVTYVPFLTDGTDSAPATIGFQPVAGACGGGIPQLVAHVNNVSVTANNDGTTDTGTASACSGLANNISITSAFQDLANLSSPGQPVRVYQTVNTTNISGMSWCNNCQDLLSNFVPPTPNTVSLTNPSLPGSVVVTFQAWHDLNDNMSIDTGEPIGDVVQYTITVHPTPVISFTAQVTGGTPQNGSSNGPTSVTLDFCAGQSFSYSNYVSVPGANVGVLNDLTGTGNVTYNGSPVSVPRAQIAFSVGDTPGFFAGTYGPYGLSSGTSGQFVETFTPYYDSDMSGGYSDGDCLGTPVIITYNVYALPNAIVTPTSQTICTNSTTNIDLSSNVPSTTFTWVVQGTTGMVSGQTAGNGTNIAQTLTNSGVTNAFVTYRVTPTGPAPNYCVGPTTDVTITVLPSLGITCPAPINVGTSSNGTGNCDGVASWTHPTQPGGSCTFETLTMSINGGTPVVVTPGASITQTFSAGDHTVTYVATDIASNMANCSFTITVTDDEEPVAACLNPTITFNGQPFILLSTAQLATASDNCGVSSIMLSNDTIFCLQVGQIVPVLVTVTDVNNNVSTCTANVTVTGLPCDWSQNSDGVGCTNGNNIAFNPATAVWTATSTNCYYAPPFNSDSHAFAQRQLCGNGIITVRIDNINGQGWAGIVMRETNVPGAKKAQLMTNLSSFNRMEFRAITGAQAYPQQIPFSNRRWLRITRTGNQFQMFTSLDGNIWLFAGAQNIVMTNCIQVGLVVTNFSSNNTVSANFSNLIVQGSNTPLTLPGNGVAELAPDLSPLTPDFSVFPNPTSGELNLDLTQYVGRSIRIEMYSIEGKLMQFNEIDEVQTIVERIDLGKYRSGLYLVKVKSEGLPDAVQRVVLQRN